MSGGPINPTRCKEKPWDLWVGENGTESPRRDEPGRKSVARRRAGVSLLHHSSMALHGQFPQTDNLNAVVCHMCGATVKCCSAYRHLVTYHNTAEPSLPPPTMPYVKLKTQNRSKHKREAPPEAERLLEPARSSHSTVYYAEPESQMAPLPVPVTVPAGEVQVCVEGELPVVSIQDPDELPLGENITDDIFAIMNSEGIQSADDPDTASWKNIIRDIGTLQDMTGEFSNTDNAFALTDDLASVQFVAPPVAPLPTVLDAVALNPIASQSSKSRPKSKSKYNFREYDPNKHCGVIAVETQKPCTRSLTCKAHTLSLRRMVEGRVKPFDLLLAEHKAAREAAALGASATQPAAVPEPIAVPISIPQSLLVNNIDLSSFNSLATEQQVTDIYTSLLNAEDHSVLPDTSAITSLLSQGLPPDQFLLTEDQDLGEVPILSIASPVEPAPPPEPPAPASRLETDVPPSIVPNDICWYPAPPRPLAVCTFNASHAGGAVLLGRKFATVRGNIKSSLSRTQGKVASGSNNYHNFSQGASLSKTVQLNNANKCNKPSVRRLVMCSDVRVKSELEDYARLNGHTLGASASLSCKRNSIDALELEAKRTSNLSMSQGLPLKSRHIGHSSSEMLELSYMLDPLVTDDNC